MAELLAGLLGLAVVVFFAGGALLGWIAFARSRATERRLSKLELGLRAQRAVGGPSARVIEPAIAGASPESARSPREERAATVAPALAPALAAVPALAPGPAVERAPAAAHAAELEPLFEPKRPPARAAKPAFELERWVGVRGAAVLGGIFLVFAGFLFLQYSIERGWATPTARLTLGGLAALGSLLGAAVLRARGYAILANSLSGAGVALGYAVAWAAHGLYQRIDFATSFAALASITALCGWLAYRHASQLIAVLGLVGGFATPLALTAVQDRPLGLVGYALVLDLGLLFVAHKRRWPAVGLLGMLGTFALLGVWVFWHRDGDLPAVGLASLGLFGLLFACAGALQPREERERWRLAQAGALLLPFAFVLHFAGSVELGWHLWPLAALAGLLSAGAGALALAQGAPWLATGTAAGSLALIALWAVANAAGLELARALELAGCALGLALLQHVFLELGARRHSREREALPAAAVLALGLLALFAYIGTQAAGVPFALWASACAALVLLLVRQTALGAHELAACAGAFAAGAGFAAWAITFRFAALGPPAWQRFAMLLGVGALCLGAAALRGRAARGAWAAAACYALPALAAGLVSSPLAGGARALALFGLLALGAQAALGATGARSSALLALAAAGTAFAQFGALGRGGRVDLDPAWARITGALALGAALFTAWPFLCAGWSRARSGPWRVAALSSLAWFPMLQAAVVGRHGPGLRFASALGLALFVGALARLLWSRGEPEREAELRVPAGAGAERAAEIQTASRARAWFAAAALFYASLALPIHVDRQPLAIGLALFALCLAWLWTHSDHRGLKYAAVAACLAALAGLAGHAFDEMASSERRVVNAHAYTFLGPACAAFGAAWLLGSREVLRARGFERQFYARKVALAAAATGACGVLLGFVWLNLEVVDAFTQGASFRWLGSLERAAKPKLALSIAWAGYALALLLGGVRTQLGGLRWASLILLLATIAKVFLHDLGHLSGLERAASMLGLALSLLAVSFLYQRYVFKRPAAA